ncbi:MAG: PAS domain S-box protein [Pseudomonadota bacterium]
MPDKGPKRGSEEMTEAELREALEASEEERLRLEEKYRLHFDNILDVIFSLDKEFKFITVSPSAEKVLGYKPEELIGKRLSDLKLITPDAIHRASSNREALKSGGILPQQEYEVTLKDGTRKWLEITVTPLFEDGELMATVDIARDITERKRAEEELEKHRKRLEELVRERTAEVTAVNVQLQSEILEKERMEAELLKAAKLESISILAGGIAHDFNNILTAIAGNISIAKMYARAGMDMLDVLDEAETATFQAKDLTQQLLTFSRGGVPIKKTASITDLVRETVDFTLRGSGISCDFSFPADIWTARIDKGQISQVISNMVINSMQAMSNGGVIRIEARNVDVGPEDVLPMEEGAYVKLSIEDHGIGIPGQNIPKIFDPFFTTKQEGSGLGLTSTYSIVKKHGGYIDVTSVVGKGTTFHIYLPAGGERISSLELELMEPQSGQGRVLLMDDEEIVCKAARKMLRHLGYETKLAGDGDEAIELYEEAMKSGRCFDIVIMDLTVPGRMGGKDAVEKLKAINPRVRAVVSSGYSNDPVMADYAKHGFIDVLVKPYRLEELSRVLKKATEEA